ERVPVRVQQEREEDEQQHDEDAPGDENVEAVVVGHRAPGPSRSSSLGSSSRMTPSSMRGRSKRSTSRHGTRYDRAATRRNIAVSGHGPTIPLRPKPSR